MVTSSGLKGMGEQQDLRVTEDLAGEVQGRW